MQKQQNNRIEKPFGLRDKLGYLLGDTGCNLSFTLISSYMLLFYTQYIGVSLMYYSFIILLTKIWDGINDPIIGAIADRFQPKGGDKFRPWIFWGSFPLAFSACLLFLDTSNMAYWVKIAVCIVGYLIWDIAYTVVNVPYGSLNSTITADPLERSQLSTWRSFGSFLAAVPMMILLPLFLYKETQLPSGETVSLLQGQRLLPISLALGCLALLCFQLLYRMTTERIKHAPHEGESFNYFKTIKSFFTNRTMLAVSLTSFVSIVFMNSSQMTNALVFQMYYGDGSLTSLALIAMLPAFLVAPFVKRLVIRFGKKALCSWPLLGGIAVYTIFLLMPEIPVWLFLAGQFVTALSSGFFLLLVWALVSDGIDSMEMQTGRREEGSAYATYSFMRKLGQGVGQWLVPFAIAMALPGLAMDNAATWNAAYGLGIKNMAVALCLVGYIVAFLLMHFLYDINKEKELALPALLGRAPKEVEAGMETIAEGMSRRDD